MTNTPLPPDRSETPPAAASRQSRNGGVLRWLIPFGLMLAALAGVGVMVGLVRNKQTAEPEPAAVDRINVSVEAVQPVAERADEILLPATVEANRIVHVAAEVPGRIDAVLCEEGAACARGDQLVRLNTDLLQAEFDRVKSQAEFDRREYERIAALEEGGAATERQVEEAKSRLEISEANLAYTRSQLERAKIVAPIGGILDRVPVEEGEYLQPGMRVASIVEMDVVKVLVDVPEPDVGYFRVGDTAEVLYRNNGEERSRTGEVAYISEVADTRTRTTPLEIRVKNDDGALNVGQIVKVRLTRRVLKDLIMVPLLAVIPLDRGNRVYVVEDDIARVRAVETTRFIRKDENGIDRVQIVSGLEPGDRLIVDGHRFVGDGQEVEVVATGAEALQILKVEGALGR